MLPLRMLLKVVSGEALILDGLPVDIWMPVEGSL